MNPPQPAPAPPPAPPRVPLIVRRGLRSPREVAFRAVIAVVILCSVVLAWWSFAKVLPPLQSKGRELSASVSRIETEVERLDRQWPRDTADQITNSYEQLRLELFSNEATFATWLANLNGQVSALTLDAKAEFGKTAPISAPGEKLAAIPATIFLEVPPSPGFCASQSPYP